MVASNGMKPSTQKNVGTLLGVWLAGCLLMPVLMGVDLALTAPLILAAVAGGIRFWLTRDPTRLRRIALVLSGAALSLAVADGFLRLTYSHRLKYRPFDEAFTRFPAYSHQCRLMPSVKISRNAYGDLAAMTGVEENRVNRTVILNTDAFGFRNDWTPVDPVDILMLGDSFCIGVGTTQADILPNQLSAALNKPVYSIAQPGNPWAELMMLKAEVRGNHIRLKEGGHLIWVLFEGNDLEESFRDMENQRASLHLIREDVPGRQTFTEGDPLLDAVDESYMPIHQVSDHHMETIRSQVHGDKRVGGRTLTSVIRILTGQVGDRLCHQETASGRSRSRGRQIRADSGEVPKTSWFQ